MPGHSLAIQGKKKKIFDSACKASPVAGCGYFEEAIRGGQVAIGKWATGGGSHIIGSPASTWNDGQFASPPLDKALFQSRHQVYHSRINKCTNY